MGLFGDLIEEGVDKVVNDVENFPDNAARWTGEKVGEVENIPQDVETDYDRAKYGVENTVDDAVQGVEDIPQDVGRGVDDAANWAGEKVGDVERFDDGVENAYDQGRDETRYGGGNY
ncbi:hypothetical protein GLOTRDRAFT_138746 [Gloeophyllum trabeum ATCC 11539]|uniref:Uncharacterized protein n=1 Tax=Gloeophyllum trabeum (strain ATCC 11539 / FP-39264 / Madison 617) TaxID=670483 RepID=S7Q4T0_GLOTA|nr:uncharacterized protein GLOTRDRAFT_138746 [Gloeophyllum trabeum ATCC 11539]EPQ55021.1 hypothetical protein GLOTRDRAFT_138746 [Gloeophyllum trabeum ATCC 11539]|eukprot:PLAT399.1.p1 GENE.PLAT399.1~~PLAT399.1.p1  ORF type:complete len:137 (-),score=6.44 PLAT399.1:54-404(-)